MKNRLEQYKRLFPSSNNQVTTSEISAVLHAKRKIVVSICKVITQGYFVGNKMVRDANTVESTLDLESGYWALVQNLPINYSVITDGHLIYLGFSILLC